MSNTIPRRIQLTAERMAEAEQRTIALAQTPHGTIVIDRRPSEQHHVAYLAIPDRIAYVTATGQWWTLPPWQLQPPHILLF